MRPPRWAWIRPMARWKSAKWRISSPGRSIVRQTWRIGWAATWINASCVTALNVGPTTGLYPATLFDGVPLFREGLEPSAEERARYLEQVWTPYHSTLQQELARLKAEFGYALLFDAHSIRSVIPHLFEGQLP